MICIVSARLVRDVSEAEFPLMVAHVVVPVMGDDGVFGHGQVNVTPSSSHHPPSHCIRR